MKEIKIKKSTRISKQFQYNSRSAAHFGVELLEEDVIVDLLETGAKTTMDLLNGGEEMRGKVHR